MADYLKKEDFDREMIQSIKDGKLTNQSIAYFTLLAGEVSKNFKFRYPEDKDGAIDNAVADFASNWKGFKWNPVFKMHITRNFIEGESLSVTIKGLDTIVYVAKKTPKSKTDFLIDKTENKSLERLKEVIEENSEGKIDCGLHKVTRKITIVDRINPVGIYGIVVLKQLGKTRIMKGDKLKTELINLEFKKPPSSFVWGTSVARNGIIKFLDRFYPKDFRGGKMMNFSEIKNDQGGRFSS